MNVSFNETSKTLEAFVIFEIVVYSFLIVSVTTLNSVLVHILFIRLNIKSFSFLLLKSLALSDLLIGIFPIFCQILIRADENFFRENLGFVIVFNIADLSQSSINLVVGFSLALHRLLLFKARL